MSGGKYSTGGVGKFSNVDFLLAPPWVNALWCTPFLVASIKSCHIHFTTSQSVGWGFGENNCLWRSETHLRVHTSLPVYKRISDFLHFFLFKREEEDKEVSRHTNTKKGNMKITHMHTCNKKATNATWEHRSYLKLKKSSVDWLSQQDTGLYVISAEENIWHELQLEWDVGRRTGQTLMSWVIC